MPLQQKCTAGYIYRWERAVGARFTGLIPPTLTPLDADERLDRPAVRRLVDFLIGGGVDGLFVLGSTGEAPCLRLSERQALVEATVEAVDGRVPVIAGVLEPATARVIDDLRALAGRGLDGYVITAPYYFSGPTDAELGWALSPGGRGRRCADLALQHSADHHGQPLGRPGPAAQRASQRRRYQRQLRNWDQVQQVILERPDPDFVVLQGNEACSTVTLLAGGDGLVPGHGNIYPRLCADLIAAARRGDLTEAFRLQARFDSLSPSRGAGLGARNEGGHEGARRDG